MVECPVCAGVRWAPWRHLPRRGGRAAWDYVACAGCGLKRLHPLPDPAALGAVFDDGYFRGGGARGGYEDYDADAEGHRANARHRLAALAASTASTASTGSGAIPAPGRLVDVGCASGYTLEEARRLGYESIGVEVSPAAANAARDKGFRVEPDLASLLLGAAEPVDGVDVVSFFQVLEHLPDPVAALRAAAALVRPGGSVLIETWDGGSLLARASRSRWQQLSPPSVLWVFEEHTLRRMLALAGLRLERWGPTSKLVSVGLVAGQLGPRLPRPLRGATAAAAARFGGVRLRYGLGDLVSAVATRSAAPTDD